MLGAIVLRDIPKQEVQIDLVRLPIQGGFRGFSMVPPAAWHYVSVKDRGGHIGFWCYVAPDTAVVKVYDYDTQQFNDADAEIRSKFSQLALGGAMGAALITYPSQHFAAWLRLVNKIPATDLPTIHETDSGGDSSRFDQAFQGTHGGNADSFLSEFQFAFAQWFVTQSTGTADETAFARWRHLVLATYNAGERRMTAAPELFAGLADSLMGQYDLLPNDWFTPDSFIASGQASYLAEDMIDSDVPILVAKGKAFAAYLQKRRG